MNRFCHKPLEKGAPRQTSPYELSVEEGCFYSSSEESIDSTCTESTPFQTLDTEQTNCE